MPSNPRFVIQYSAPDRPGVTNATFNALSKHDFSVVNFTTTSDLDVCSTFITCELVPDAANAVLKDSIRGRSLLEQLLTSVLSEFSEGQNEKLEVKVTSVVEPHQAAVEFHLMMSIVDQPRIGSEITSLLRPSFSIRMMNMRDDWIVRKPSQARLIRVYSRLAILEDSRYEPFTSKAEQALADSLTERFGKVLNAGMVTKNINDAMKLLQLKLDSLKHPKFDAQEVPEVIALLWYTLMMLNCGGPKIENESYDCIATEILVQVNSDARPTDIFSVKLIKSGDKWQPNWTLPNKVTSEYIKIPFKDCDIQDYLTRMADDLFKP